MALDVCQATQRDLERFFRQSGRCFGDLRRMQLLAQQMRKNALRMHHAMMSSMRPSAAPSPTSEDAFIQAYFDRFVLAERFPEDRQPRFSGGTLEKHTGATRLCCQVIKNERARNATQHRFARPAASRKSIRHDFRPRPPRASSLVDLLDALLAR